MPTFDDSATSAAPVEEVWKLLYDPARMVEWWEGVERVEPSGEGEITVYPDGYPDFPMPQELRTAAHGRGLTISCLVSYLVFEWQLEALGDGTRIAVVLLPALGDHGVDAARLQRPGLLGRGGGGDELDAGGLDRRDVGGFRQAEMKARHRRAHRQ